MRLAKLKHFLRYGISCTDDEWETRQGVIKVLRQNGYFVEEVPNPCRLNAGKGEEQFLIDILDKDRVHVMPVKWVFGYTDQPVLVTDIPSTGRYGIWNKESQYYDEIKQLAGKQELVGKGRGEG